MTGIKPQTIYFLSASDRINYGDLLFPLVFRAFSKQEGYHVAFYNYGVVKSNLTHFKALPTNSYANLLKDIQGSSDKLLIGGGEVFFANWSTLYSFINPLFAFIFRFKKIRRLIDKFNLSSKLLGTGNVCFPFCPSVDELRAPNLKIYYSSVGGGFSKKVKQTDKSHLIRSLKQSRLISVRDNRTFINLKENSISSELVPDSALIMSDLFPLDFLQDQVSFSQNRFSTPYLFLQIARFKGPTDLLRFSKSLRKLSEDLQLSVVLCPIGLCPGHEDDIILRELSLLDENFIYFEPMSVFDIMYLISQSKLYMGTSLHGVITAHSFGVPCFGLNKKLSKVDSYIQTWIGNDYGCLDFDSLPDVVTLYKNWPFEKINTLNDIHKSQVRLNLHKILQDK